MGGSTQRWEKDGNRDLDVWRLPDGQVHRTDGPAYRRLLDDTCETEIWAQNGEYSRPDGGPTGLVNVHFYKHHDAKPDDVVVIEVWAVGPVDARPYVGTDRVRRHRIDGPAEVRRFRNGNVRAERWFVDGELHRTDGPAETIWNIDGQVVAEAWYRNGERAASPDGATNREFFDNGISRRQMWLDGKKLHNEDGPAYLEWFSSGTPKSVEYWVDGVMSLADGPAATEYSADGMLLCEQWRMNDRLHRVGDAAVTFFHPNGNPAEYQWWTEGSRRVDGPAIGRFDELGEQTLMAEWVMPEAQAAARDRIDYQRHSSDPESDSARQMAEADAGRSLRLWHRWMLGLDLAPEDAPFTQGDWIRLAPAEELTVRLAYFPQGDRIAERILDWRTWPPPEFPDDEDDIVDITLAFVHYLSDTMKRDVHRQLFDGALAGDLFISEEPPEPGDGEYAGWDLNESMYNMTVPSLLHESIYHMSGNNFMPIYWILEPLHGVDVSAWRDFHQAHLKVVIGPDQIVVGPSY